MLSRTGWIWLAASVFGLSIALFAFDVVVAASGSNFPHRSTIGTVLRVITFAYREWADSWIPMLKALKLLYGEHGSALYETLFFTQRIKFQYPPTSLLFLHALRQFEIPAMVSLLNKVNFVVYIANAAVIAAVADILAQTSQFYQTQGLRARKYVLSISFLAALVFYPNVEAIRYGQIQMWIDFAFSAGVLAWLLGYRTLVGVLLGLACAIKPQFVLILIWALLWRDWRFVRGFVAVVIPFGLLSVALYGLHNNIAYLKVLSFIAERGESFYINVSVNGIANRLLFNGDPGFGPREWDGSNFPPPHPIVLWATRLAFAAFIVAGLRRAIARAGGEPSLFDLCCIVLCSVISSPVAWDHHYGVMMPMFVVAFFAVFRSRDVRPSDLYGLWISWMFAANYTRMIELLNGTYLNILQNYLFFAGLWLLWFLVRQHHALARGDAIRTSADIPEQVVHDAVQVRNAKN